MKTNDTAKNTEKTAKTKITIPDKVITAYDFMVNEDEAQDLNHVSPNQKNPSSPRVETIDEPVASRSKQEVIRLSNVKSQSALQSAQSVENYRKSL